MTGTNYVATHSALRPLESSNTVGYQKIPLTPGFNMISAGFVPVGGEAVTDVLSVMGCAGVLPSIDPDTETGEGFARLEKWTGSGYEIYEWTGEGIAEAWEWEGIDNKWMTTGCEDIAEVGLKAGEGYWLWLDPAHTSGALPVVIAGEVPSEEKVTLPLNSGFNLIANPYPVSMDIQDIKFQNLPSIDPDTETGEGFARLETWNGSGYEIYEWTGEGIAEAWEWEGIDNKWMTTGCEDVAENVVLDMGKAFWLWLDPTVSAPNASVEFDNPIK